VLAAVEYYNGTQFILNAEDNCTVLDSSNLSFYDYAGNLAAGDTLATGTGTLVGGLSTVMSLSAPGDSKAESVKLTYDLSLAGLDWLKTNTLNPHSVANFGIFSGADIIIYRREAVW